MKKNQLNKRRINNETNKKIKENNIKRHSLRPRI